MKKTIVGSAIAIAAVCTVAVAPASANSDQGFLHNCTGLTTQYVARGNDISPFNSANGIGNVAAANDATTQQTMDYIKFVVCA